MFAAAKALDNPYPLQQIPFSITNPMCSCSCQGSLFLFQTKVSYSFMLIYQIAFFKQKLICIYDFDLQDAIKLEANICSALHKTGI